jgi:hypothetical protein
MVWCGAFIFMLCENNANPTPDIIASVLYDNPVEHTPNSSQQPPPSSVCNCTSLPMFSSDGINSMFCSSYFIHPYSLLPYSYVQSPTDNERGSKSRESWRFSPSGNTIRLVSDDGAVSRIANPNTAPLMHITPASARGHHPDSCDAPSNAMCIAIRCS